MRTAPALPASLEACTFLLRAVNIHGKVRPGRPLEMARKNVSNAISCAKSNLIKADYDIGRHFEVFVKPRGTAFVYEQDQEID
jgi:hypothetical protein